jgi:hypothetical protein
MLRQFVGAIKAAEARKASDDSPSVDFKRQTHRGFE